MRIDWREEQAGDVDLRWGPGDGLAVSPYERDEVRYKGCGAITVVLLARARQLPGWEDRRNFIPLPSRAYLGEHRTARTPANRTLRSRRGN